MRKLKFTDFTPTDKSLVNNPNLWEEIQNLIAQRYCDPLYLFLRKKGHGDEEAEDILQSFFLKCIMNPKFLRRIPRRKGSFRAFLLQALKYHRSQFLRKSKKRSAISQEIIDDLPEKVPQNPEDAYNYAWAVKLFDAVVAEVEASYRKDGEYFKWEIFRERELEPKMKGVKPPSLAGICRKYDIKKTSTVTTIVYYVRKRFYRIMWLQVRPYVNSNDEVEQEIRELIQILSKTPRNIIENPADI